jgi:SAM-dependent methyltransferase
MRVLDLGCGAGDVSLLLSDLVGRDGSIVAIDQLETALVTAQDRLQRAGVTNVTMHHSAVSEFADRAGFDFAIGRYVLVHQVAPAQFIADAARLLRAGGILAFHEINEFSGGLSLPLVPLWDQITNVATEVMRRIVASPDAALRLAESFDDAGLKAPSLVCERVVGTCESAEVMAWAALTFREMLSRAQEFGLIAEDEIAVEGLEARVRAAVATARAQIVAPEQYCAWARV